MDITIQGKHATAVVHAVDDGANAVDAHALAQIQMLCDAPACAGSKIRVMPDVHAGKVGPIGLTMSVRDKVMPALIGNDIGCGVTATQVLAKGPVDFARLDKVVREACLGNIRRSRGTEHEKDARCCARALLCRDHVQEERAVLSVGTLGGGNHFIELGQSAEPVCGNYEVLYLTVHSGSRILGQQVYDHYMRGGQRALKKKGVDVPYEMTWLEDDLLAAYKEDVGFTCTYAEVNREAIISSICKGMKWGRGETFVVPHNYIDEWGLLRKGAISADENELVLIPINMHDGVILGFGRGNPDWNYSAPHGAGRILKRSDVRSRHTVSEFKRQMKGIWSSCISAGTLDEAPFAYRSIDEIRAAIDESVEVVDIIAPLYSFKAGGDRQ